MRDEMTAKRLAQHILKLIKKGELKPGAQVQTNEGFVVWESNIRIEERGKLLVL